MKKWYKIILGVIFSILFLSIEADAISFNSWNAIYGLKDKEGYAEGHLSSAVPQYINLYTSDESRKFISGSLSTYEKDIAEINKRNKVQVYVNLIARPSLPYYCAVPKETSTLSNLFDWSDKQKSFDQFSYKDVETEAKEIAEKLAAEKARNIKDPVVFCTLIQFDIQYGLDKGKRVTLYHSVAYGFEGSENYLNALNENVKQNIEKKTWSASEEGKLAQLISIIRVVGQKHIEAQVNEEILKTLREKLLAENSRSAINNCIDTLDKNIILLFDNQLRGYVVYRLFGAGDVKYNPTIYGGHMSTPYDKNIVKNSLAVLENIKDVDIEEWFKYINTSGTVTSKSILQELTGGIEKGFFNDEGYEGFIKIVNKQLRLDPSFQKRKEDFEKKESSIEKNIVWDKSYFLNLFTTAPINTNKYKVELQDDGKIKLTKYFVEKWLCTPRIQSAANGAVTFQSEDEDCMADWKEEAPIFLNPFDIIGFVNRSDLSLLTESRSTTDGVVIVPAVHLLYASKMKWNEDVGKGLSLAYDVGTFVIPVSKLTYGPKLARKVLYGIELSDKLATAGGIAVTLGAIEDKQFIKVITAYGRIHMLLSVGVAGYKVKLDELRDLADFVRAVSKQEAELKVLAKTNQKARDLLELKNKINNEGLAVRGEDWVAKYGSDVDVIADVITVIDDYVATTGKIVVGQKNLLDVKSIKGRFKRLGSKENPLTAGEFWLKETEDIIQFTTTEGKYYIKHDPKTGQILFAKIDGEEVNFLSYAIDEEKFIGNNYDKLLVNLKTIHGLPGGNSSLTINGVEILLSQEKSNGLLGKYGPRDIPGILNEIGTDDVIKELGILKNYSFADNKFYLHKGSIHILNVPDVKINGKYSMFFEQYNKDFLDYLLSNKEYVEIILVSDPRKSSLLDLYDKDIWQFINKPTGFAKEIRYLRDRGVTTVKLRDGSSINLKEIDLDYLNWSDWPY